MTQLIHEIMTQQLHSIRSEATLLEVATLMRDRRIGTVLVTSRDGTLRGIVTGRDIVVRAMAEARPLDRTQAWEICSNDLVKVAPTTSIEATKQLMRERAIRRVPVVANGVAVGIVSLGDLARQAQSNLAASTIGVFGETG